MNFIVKSTVARGDPLSLSIYVRGGKGNNNDFFSSGEWTRSNAQLMWANYIKQSYVIWNVRKYLERLYLYVDCLYKHFKLLYKNRVIVLNSEQ